MGLAGFRKAGVSVACQLRLQAPLLCIWRSSRDGLPAEFECRLDMSSATSNFWTSWLERVIHKDDQKPHQNLKVEIREEDETDRSIPNLMRWRQSFDVKRKQWLILGKGPSYAELSAPHLDRYYTCSLNHVVREHPVDLAHAIDIDVVRECSDVIARHARFLILPYYPHERFVPSAKSIHEFVREMPVLQSLKSQGRLVWYNLSTSRKQVGLSPMIEGWNFSAEAAVDILATCGVRMIRSLGIDGGSRYAACFSDLEPRTLLANTRSSFDVQFGQIAKTMRTKGVFYAPLNKQAPIRVFVGTDRSQLLAARVLEYSIKKYASMSVEVQFMCDLPVPRPKDYENRPRTGFSFARFLIPSLCNYQGTAIYVDADMLVFDDIAKVWDQPLGSADILCVEQPTEKGRIRQYSVLLMDCAKLSWNIQDIIRGLDEHRYNYSELMHEFCIVPREKVLPQLPYEWNSLEYYEANRTRLIHYTDMSKQPWVCFDNPYGALWYQTLREAIAEGFISAEEVRREIRRGHVHPQLAPEIGLRAPWYRQLRPFIAPYKRL